MECYHLRSVLTDVILDDDDDDDDDNNNNNNNNNKQAFQNAQLTDKLSQRRAR